jgi:hypothetical protein
VPRRRHRHRAGRGQADALVVKQLRPSRARWLLLVQNGAESEMGLEGRAEALAGTFNAQNVANTLWAYATMGREPGAGVMRGLEGRAEALADTFKAQDVANTLWAYATMAFFALAAGKELAVLGHGDGEG